ncbi:sce7726 family protein [Agrobacterium burrii]|uniref:Sce7726 family protein n=1 Tax=Agrobacterium burrii TaxID=2815339 RepID=A0ABS3EJX6_9HYPH|nr:sce7726 family protein [Agrobacterium burrii]MBO0132278.1 sce7726 family protein [Agrobacterium burrii]
MKNNRGLVTNDGMIREAVRARLARAHAGEDAVIVDELKVARGSSRMDVAVINGRIEGYEIKSDKDTLDRLPKQAEMFGQVADRMTLVVGERHLAQASAIVPDWWGIMTPEPSATGALRLREVRKGRTNKCRDNTAMVQSLERDEIVALLSLHGIAKGMRTAGYATLVRHAVASLTRDQIADHLKHMLKVRAKLGARFCDRAFGRNAIICSMPSE